MGQVAKPGNNISYYLSQNMWSNVANEELCGTFCYHGRVKINRLLHGKVVRLCYLYAVNDNMTTQRLKRHRKKSKERLEFQTRRASLQLVKQSFTMTINANNDFEKNIKVINWLLKLPVNWTSVLISLETQSFIFYLHSTLRVSWRQKIELWVSRDIKTDVQWHIV